MAAPSKERLAELIVEFDRLSGKPKWPPKPIFVAMSDVYEAGRRAKLWKGPKYCWCRPSQWREFSAHVHRILGN